MTKRTTYTVKFNSNKLAISSSIQPGVIGNLKQFTSAAYCKNARSFIDQQIDFHKKSLENFTNFINTKLSQEFKSTSHFTVSVAALAKEYNVSKKALLDYLRQWRTKQKDQNFDSVNFDYQSARNQSQTDDYLLSKLQKQAHLSLAQRAAGLNTSLGRNYWSAYKLRKVYKRLGIKLKKVITKRPFRRVDTAKTLKQDRECFELMKLQVIKSLSRNQEIVQVDECVFSAKTYKQQAWAQKYSNIVQTQYLKQQKCLAVVAGVSAQRGLIAFNYKNSSINGEMFISFLEHLRSKSGKRRLTLLLDNCSIHHTKAVQARASQLNLNLVYNVPYSPWFNGIELVWAMAKREFRKELLRQLTNQIETEDFKVTATKVLNELNPEHVKNCCSNAIRLIERTQLI